MTEITTILEKAGSLFKRYGVKSITMEDISSELGVSKKTLYRFVEDKFELINKVINDDYISYKVKLESVMQAGFDPILQQIQIFLLTIRFLNEYHPVLEYDLQKYYQKVHDKAREGFFELFRNAIIQNINYGMELDIYRKDLDPEIISKIQISGIENASKSKIFSFEEFKSVSYKKELLSYHFKGLVSDKGEILLKKYIEEFKSKNYK